MDLTVRRSTSDPQVARFIDNTSRFADATARFSDALVKFPRDLSLERVAAIDQMLAGVTEQRKALTRDLAGHEQRVDGTIVQLRGIVDRADETGKSLNAATSQTIGTAEQSARRTLTLMFVLAAALVVTTLALLPCYRVAVGRWALHPHHA